MARNDPIADGDKPTKLSAMRNSSVSLAVVRRSLVVALSLAGTSCAYGEDRCRSLSHLGEGYQNVPMVLSWSGVAMDRPNFTLQKCDLPATGVITSSDTMDMLAARIRDGKLTADRSSFMSEVDAFLYVSGEEAFVVGLGFDKSSPPIDGG